MLSTVDTVTPSNSAIQYENGMVYISRGGCETIGLLVERDGADHGVMLSPSQAREIADGLYANARTYVLSA